MENFNLHSIIKMNSTVSLLFGIFLTVIGSIFMAIANTFMKLGLSDSKKKKYMFTNYSCDMKWYIGFIVYCFGSFLHIIALGFAPASTLAPMNSFGLIANAIVANIYLNEKLGKIELISTFGIFFGISICACASFLCETEKVHFNPIHIIESWKNPWYIFYIFVSIFLSFFTLIYLNHEENKIISENEEIYAAKRYVELNVMDEKKQETEDENINSLINSKTLTEAANIYPKTIGLAYGFLAGLIGSQCVLEIKEIVAFLHIGLNNKHIYRTPLPHLCFVFLIISIYLQIHFLNLGLTRGEATLVVPTYYVFWTFFGTLGGLVKFNEIENFNFNSILLFLVGFLLTVLFISILAVQEITFLRKYVDKEVPDLPLENLDIHTQVLQNKKLSKQVILNMGLFPVSLLGTTVGRKKFRPLYERFRRTRSILSDTHIGDQHCEYSIDNNIYNAYTLPYDIYNTNTDTFSAKKKKYRHTEPRIENTYIF
ncbi:inner membrane complex protein [Plasmodium gaboni]|uniref:Inner membrane complex protein n=1 Tax=Plasmodium gaboni TaxID=647221 RepID=A0A151LTD0_9APIC|nr:inner membrane complex protein [Plasmodium gaboni]XP_028537070.1 inner membrane complex protein [Plasmodium sp. gorilla clade G2]SOV21430.1 inner membrane complex protein [Plasmodium sp. DRC-Itaito]KYO02422.1 inner membrane complex protein [Plasmodium gaboni]SOV11832.1 inner membrane complex protein [Plasmodium sp. gorilla clade G2]SOV12052.1 inner membrane complex protein [Plasmodium gaboni]